MTSLLSILKVDMYNNHAFIFPDLLLVEGIFEIYSLVPKKEICLKYFLDKNSQKQTLWPDVYFAEPDKTSLWVVWQVHLISVPDQPGRKRMYHYIK